MHRCKRLGVQGMEVYSTALWHLKREVELSHLAQEALALDRLSPHTCCVLGNCFSLQKVPPAPFLSVHTCMRNEGQAIVE